MDQTSVFHGELGSNTPKSVLDIKDPLATKGLQDSKG